MPYDGQEEPSRPTLRVADKVERNMSRKQWFHVSIFILFTFGLAWLEILLASQQSGLSLSLEAGLPQLGMLFPAFVALLLQVFGIKDSPVYYQAYREKPRWIVITFFALTLIIGFINLLARISDFSITVLGGVANVFVLLWTLLIMHLYRRHGEESFRRAGLQLGDTDRGARFVIAIVLFLLSQALLNWIFGLGSFTGICEEIAGIPIPRVVYPLGLVVFFLLSIIGTPLGGLAMLFGEEYAWRGFLQSHLMTMGRRRGALLVGVIWGLWHFPIILSGIHTYPPTALGLGLGVVFFALWGIVQSYAVLKTNSIWVAAFMHGVVNSVYSFSLIYLVRPYDKVYSFGLGLYGLALLVVVVIFVLRDPVWNARETSLE